MSQNGWITLKITIQTSRDGSMDLYCWCKRKLREKYNDGEMYCRKHGLQATYKIDQAT